MADQIKMARTEALQIANRIKQISIDNQKAVNDMKSQNAKLTSGWIGDGQVAYSDCFNAAAKKLETYTQLLEEYSATLTKVINEGFSTDQQMASQIRSKFNF